MFYCKIHIRILLTPLYSSIFSVFQGTPNNLATTVTDGVCKIFCESGKIQFYGVTDGLILSQLDDGVVTCKTDFCNKGIAVFWMYSITINTATSITVSDLQCPLIVDENYWVTVGVVLASVSIILISLTIIGLCCYFRRKSSPRPYLYVINLYSNVFKSSYSTFFLSLF